MDAAASTLADRKLELIQLLCSTEDEAVIVQIESIFQFEKITLDD